MAFPGEQFSTPEARERLRTTRKAWHQVGEWLLAGPQYRKSGTIRLGVQPGGFATRDGATRVIGDQLLLPEGVRVTLKGTLGQIAQEADIDGGAPEGLYSDGSDADASSEVTIDEAAAEALGKWFSLGFAALRSFAPGETPVLWPEHFDLAVTVESVNYGVSLGDEGVELPYVYVGPWRVPAGEFWNQPFGAARTWQQVADEEAVVDFFQRGRDLT